MPKTINCRIVCRFWSWVENLNLRCWDENRCGARGSVFCVRVYVHLLNSRTCELMMFDRMKNKCAAMVLRCGMFRVDGGEHRTNMKCNCRLVIFIGYAREETLNISLLSSYWVMGWLWYDYDRVILLMLGHSSDSQSPWLILRVWSILHLFHQAKSTKYSTVVPSMHWRPVVWFVSSRSQLAFPLFFVLLSRLCS
jgi:hypothetical protein